MRQNYFGAAIRAHEGTNIQSMFIWKNVLKNGISRKKHMLFSLVFKSKVVQYSKVMMIAAFFSTLP